MVFEMNVFRILGDVSHTVSKCILIWSIHRNRSAEGVSLLTQLLYTAVFVTRYLDIFRAESWQIPWNIFFKFFYIFSSIYIVFLMMKIFPRTREKEKGWKLATYSALGSLVGAPIVTVIARGGFTSRPFSEMFWTFSIILESVCVLPQLLLLRQTSVPTVIDSFYLVTLGSYRGFYILNWIVRAAGSEHYFDPVSTLFGIVQTVLYIDFAWVYWTRQRVKLRNGGVVDSDDLRKSWVVGRMLGGRASHSVDEEDRPADVHGANGEDAPNSQRYNRWGTRGVSVAADDTLQDHSGTKSLSKANHDDDEDGFGDTLEDDYDDEGVGSSDTRTDDR